MKDNIIHSWEDFLRIVKVDHSINFVAKAVTQWNALSIDALIFFLQDRGYNINASIVIAEHHKASYLITESFFTNSCAHYYRLPYSVQKEQDNNHEAVSGTRSKIREVIDYYKKVFTFCKISPSKDILFYSTFYNNTPDAVLLQQLGDFGRPIVICQTEEGIGGTYLGSFFKLYPSFRELHSFKELHGYIRTVFFGKILYRKLHTNINSLTFKDTITGLKINSRILPYYRKAFELRNKKINIDVEKELIESSVIICTSSMNRELVKENEDLKVLQKVCENLHTRGYNLLLKPHPRDTFFPTQIERLHCELLNIPDISLESLCEYAKPLAVISFASTVLVNPSIFWNIPTFCISDMLNSGKIDQFYVDEAVKFKQTFHEFVHFVSSVKEIQI